jgi:hypothetical protein
LTTSVLAQLEAWVQQGRQPDLTLWLDLPAATAAQRRAAVRAPDRFETQDLAFFERVMAGYQRAALADPGRFAKIDARAPVDAVWQQILAELQSGGHGGRRPGRRSEWRTAPALAGRTAGPRAGRAARARHAAARSPGVGALEFALVLGMAWLCEAAPPTAGHAAPCGRCGSCRLAQSHGHPDLLVLMPETVAP